MATELINHQEKIVFPASLSNNEKHKILKKWAWDIMTMELADKPMPQEFDLKSNSTSYFFGPGDIGEEWSEKKNYKLGTADIGLNISVFWGGKTLIREEYDTFEGFTIATYGFEDAQSISIDNKIISWQLKKHLHEKACERLNHLFL